MPGARDPGQSACEFPWSLAADNNSTSASRAAPAMPRPKGSRKSCLSRHPWSPEDGAAGQHDPTTFPDQCMKIVVSFSRVSCGRSVSAVTPAMNSRNLDMMSSAVWRERVVACRADGDPAISAPGALFWVRQTSSNTTRYRSRASDTWKEVGLCERSFLLSLRGRNSRGENTELARLPTGLKRARNSR